MKKHTWKKREASERTRITNVSGNRYGRERVEIPAYEICENCGVTRAIRGGVEWSRECRKAS